MNFAIHFREIHHWSSASEAGKNEDGILKVQTDINKKKINFEGSSYA